MISVFWMAVIALGFMISGAFLWEFEWKIGLVLFCGTWLWMAFPKAIDWSCRAVGRLVLGKRTSDMKT